MRKLLILLALALPAQAADINAASCSQADVQAAINTAVSGDRVLVPACGITSWTITVSIPSTAITLQGNGIGSTNILCDLTSSCLTLNLPGTGKTRITGFTLDGNGLTRTGTNALINIVGHGFNSFRIDHNRFLNAKARLLTYQGDGQDVSGVIDNNTFENAGLATQGYTLLCAGVVGSGSGSAPENIAFDRALGLGTNDNIFLETNTFIWTGTWVDGPGTAGGGCRYVFRYNTIQGSEIGNHGADSGGRRGVINAEIYNNTMTNVPGFNQRFAHFRSGVLTMFGNTATGTFTSIQVANYRSCEGSGISSVWATTGGGTGYCDGTNAWDQNTPGGEGYKCLDQVGALFPAAQGGGPASSPSYFWDNVKNGAPIGATVNPQCSRVTTLHLLEDRDFINSARPAYTPFPYPYCVSGNGPGCGAGVPVALLVPTAMAFADQQVETTGPTQVITLFNIGSGLMNITLPFTISADWTQTATTCGATLAASASCTITIAFRPHVAGARTGTVSITTDAAGSPHTVALTGTGMGVVNLGGSVPHDEREFP